MARTPLVAGMTVHQRIIRAAKRGTGLRLSVDDVFKLSRDQAIAQVAENDNVAVAESAAEYAKKHERTASGTSG